MFVHQDNFITKLRRVFMETLCLAALEIISYSALLGTKALYKQIERQRRCPEGVTF